MRKIWIAFLMIAPCLFAQGGEKNGQEVSGGVVTNILSEKGTVNGKDFIFTTLGTVTGDLKGALAFISSESRRDRTMVSLQRSTIIG